MKQYRFKKSLLLSSIFRSDSAKHMASQFNDVYRACRLMGQNAWPTIMDGCIIEESNFTNGVARVQKYQNVSSLLNAYYAININLCEEVK